MRWGRVERGERVGTVPPRSSTFERRCGNLDGGFLPCLCVRSFGRGVSIAPNFHEHRRSRTTATSVVVRSRRTGNPHASRTHQSKRGRRIFRTYDTSGFLLIDESWSRSSLSTSIAPKRRSLTKPFAPRTSGPYQNKKVHQYLCMYIRIAFGFGTVACYYS
jgi:hypothetical protein